ncbi:hypothetical protein [Achromobacter sp.]|uniref:hypothetical protein n=1 Tax=Achromobacter sp. TaxID=134375 RepID=UPI0028AEAA8B|nr:hypothetical protein [Achromobacter sp.]
MGDRNTSLVNTEISRAVAPKAALELYERLLDSGVILPELRDDLSLGGFAFPLRDDFRGLDDLEDWRSPEQAMDSHSPGHTCITAIEIGVTGYRWHIGLTGRPELTVQPGNNGLYMNFDGGFSVNCPFCRSAVKLGADGSEGLYEALNAWQPSVSRRPCLLRKARTGISHIWGLDRRTNSIAFIAKFAFL